MKWEKKKSYINVHNKLHSALNINYSFWSIYCPLKMLIFDNTSDFYKVKLVMSVFADWKEEQQLTQVP